MKYLTVYTTICLFRLWSNGCPSGRNDCAAAAAHWRMYWYSDNMWSSSCMWLNGMCCAIEKRNYRLIISPMTSSLIVLVCKFGLRPTVYSCKMHLPSYFTHGDQTSLYTLPVFPKQKQEERASPFSFLWNAISCIFSLRTYDFLTCSTYVTTNKCVLCDSSYHITWFSPEILNPS